MLRTSLRTIAFWIALCLLPLAASAQSNTARSLVDSIQVETAMLHGNLEVTTTPNIEQLRTRLRTARDHVTRIQALISVAGSESQATAELDGMDRELLVLQGMIEGSYINGRDFMLAHVRNIQAYSASLRALVSASVAPPATSQPVIQQPPVEPTQPPPQPPVPTAMEPGAFMSLLSAVDAQSFSDGKIAVLRQAVAAGNYFSCSQVGQLVQLMDFGDDKIEVVVTTYPRIVDPQNLFTIYAHFDFDSDIEELQQRLGIW